MQIIIVVSLVFAVFIAFFAVQNAGVVIINFLWYKLSMSQAVVILCSALIGVLIMLPFDAVRTIKYKLKLKELSVENKRLKEELKKAESKKEQAVNEIPQIVEEISDIEKL
ncbi:MAG TPA: LapA family protein [Bacillota bacterium]|nr:LapA family protein [Bacillota bacterium]HPL54535.1 LapA family protein [Bacillota bacterium]